METPLTPQQKHLQMLKQYAEKLREKLSLISEKNKVKTRN
jgi:hypothetical protein